MVLILRGVTEVTPAVADLSSTEVRKVLAYAARGGAGGGGKRDAATAAIKIRKELDRVVVPAVAELLLAQPM